MEDGLSNVVATIDFKGVVKSYGAGKAPAVDHLDLQVPAGKIFGFLGPNGAGKSTTIKMIVGILRQDSGTISVLGHDNLTDAIAIKSEIGYVPDEPIFYEKMTGLKHINFICDLFQVSPEKRERLTLSLAKEFDMTSALSDPISSYSHGMKQKLGVIAALVHEPSLLVLDEPMVGLDPKASFILKDQLKEFCRRGGTVFFSTHVMEVAQNLCDQVGIINNGKLLFNGTFAQLQEQGGERHASLEELFLKLTGDGDVLAAAQRESER